MDTLGECIRTASIIHLLIEQASTDTSWCEDNEMGPVLGEISGKERLIYVFMSSPEDYSRLSRWRYECLFSL
jgi:hypothetical protein